VLERAGNVVRYVLDEGAAQGDVQDLCAAADREHRQVALDRACHQFEFERVAVARALVRVVGLLAVQPRVHVRTAGEQEPVYVVPGRRAERSRSVDEERLGAATAHGFEVVVGRSGLETQMIGVFMIRCGCGVRLQPGPRNPLG